ncbi:MAG: PilI type IV pilus biogenesis protein [Firmicutes bacterium]|nr:PilI type IV pilus biogenesis protein [Bacillota bacterium]
MRRPGRTYRYRQRILYRINRSRIAPGSHAGYMEVTNARHQKNQRYGRRSRRKRSYR